MFPFKKELKSYSACLLYLYAKPCTCHNLEFVLGECALVIHMWYDYHAIDKRHLCRLVNDLDTQSLILQHWSIAKKL